MPGCSFLSTQNFHPRDANISFDEDTHIYRLFKPDGSVYIFPRSVSGFVKSFFKHFDSKAVIDKNINKWKSDPQSKYKRFLDAVQNEFPSSSCFKQSKFISEAWKMNGERQSSLGTALHLAIETVLNGQDDMLFINKKEEEENKEEDFNVGQNENVKIILEELTSEKTFKLQPKDAQSLLKTFIPYLSSSENDFFSKKEKLISNFSDVHNELESWRRWKSQNEHLIPYRTEWSVYSEEHDIAGQIDAIFIDKRTGDYVLVDWKRVSNMEYESSSPFSNEKYGKPPFQKIPDTNFGHYTLQVQLYEMILLKFYDIKISKKILVQIHPSIPFPGFAEHEIK